MHDHAVEVLAEGQRLRLRRGGPIVGGLPSVDPRVEVVIAQHGAQIGIIGGIVGFHRVAGGDVVPVVRRDARLDVEEALGLRLRVLIVVREFRVAQLPGDHVHIRVADRRVVVLAIVGFVGQSKAGLLDMDDVGLRCAGVSIYGNADQIGSAGRIHVSQRADQRAFVGRGIDGGQLVGDRGKTRGVDRFLVKEAMEQRARFRRGAGRGIRIRGGGIGRIVCGVVLHHGIILEDVANLVFGVLGQPVEGAVAGTVVGKAVRVDPRAVDIAEQILRRRDHGGERCRINA